MQTVRAKRCSNSPASSAVSASSRLVAGGSYYRDSCERGECQRQRDAAQLAAGGAGEFSEMGIPDRLK